MKRKFSSFSPPKSAGKENKSRWKSHFQRVPLDLVEIVISEVIFYSGFSKTVPINRDWSPHKRPGCLHDKRADGACISYLKKSASPRDWAV